MASELSQDVDDVLSMKLSIEPTGATASSLNELMGLSEQVLSTISKTASAYAETAKQASNFRDILAEIDADKHADISTMELGRVAQSTVIQDLSPQHDLAFERAQVDNSLNRRNLDNSTETVNAVTDMGLEEALSETLARENGKLVDQLSGVAARLAEDIKHATTGTTERTTSRIMERADDSIAERIYEVVEKFRKDSNEKLDKQINTSFDIAENTKRVLDIDGRETADRLRSLGGRRTGSDFFDAIMGHADKVSNLGKMTPGVLDDVGSVLEDTPGMVMAGGALKGAAGEGGLGTKIAGAARGIGAVASKAAVPLAIGAAAWTGLNKGAEFYRETGQSGRDEGYTGQEAFTKGMVNRLDDTLRGLNPFSSSSAADFAAYRSMALNSPYHIQSTDPEYRTFTAGASSMKDMGLDPRHMIALFGKAIDEDPDFDVDTSLQELSAAAKEAEISIQELTERTAEYNAYVQDILGIEGADATGKSMDDLAFLQGEGGIFSKGEVFGDLSEQQQMSMLTDLTSVSGAFMSSQALRNADPETYARLYQDNRDPVSLMRAWYEDATPEEVASLLYDKTTKPWGNESFYSQDRDDIALRQIGGVLHMDPDRVPASLLEGIREGSSGRTGDQQVLHTYEHKIEIKLGENMVGQFTSYQDAEKYLDDKYEERKQSGYLNSPTAAHSYGQALNITTGGTMPSYAAGSQR